MPLTSSGLSTETGEAPMMICAVGLTERTAPELGLDAGAVGGVDLVEHDDVGEAQVDLARVVDEAVAGTVRVGDGDVQVGLVER